MTDYRKTAAILASLMVLTAFTVGYELHSQTITEDIEDEPENHHGEEHHEEEHHESEEHSGDNENHEEDHAHSLSISDAVEESNLVIFVLLFNLLIVLTSIYFIIKILIDVWRGTIKG